MTEEIDNFTCNEIRIGIVGSVDSGKSTITGVLTKGELDNGRGSARSHILKHPHEKQSGRTSDIAQHFVREGDNIVEYIDLAGHEKYSKTTIGGIKKCDIDYGMLTVGLNMGVLPITRDHCELILSSNVPIFVVCTKNDLPSDYIRDQTLNSIEMLFKNKNPDKKNPKYKTLIIDNDISFEENENIKDVLENYTYLKKKSEMKSLLIPIFRVSSVTGYGIDIVKKFIFNLKQYKNYDDNVTESSNFIINNGYYVNGVGVIASGFVKQGVIKIKDKLFLGPDEHGKFKEVTVRSIHNNFREHVEYLSSGQGGSFNIVFTGKDKIKKADIKKGYRLLQDKVCFKQFTAIVKILKHSSTISLGYQPTIHIGNVSQCAEIKKIYKKKNRSNSGGDDGDGDDGKFLRIGDVAHIDFEFLIKPEYIDINSNFIFREGKAKGVGKILERIAYDS